MKVSGRLQIVFLVHDIHYGGGGERVTVNLGNYFSEKGYNVKIVSLSPAKTSNVYTLNKEIIVQYLNIDFDSGSNLINKIRSVFKVILHFAEYRNNTIILGIGNYPSLLLCFLPRRTNIKTIGCQHLAYSGVKHVWAVLRKMFFYRLSFVVCLTKRDLPNYRKLNKNCLVIPNSIQFSNKQKSPLTRKRILFIGRMVPDKGYDLLLKVIKKVSRINKDWEFRIVGDGYLKNKILREIELSGLSDKISWLSSTDTVEEEYLNSSIYLMTSRTEGFPMVLLEAQACGLPVVSFDCPTGPSDIVNDNENGYLISCFNIDEIAQKVSQLCSDYDLRVKFGNNALQNVEKFRPEIVNSAWQELFSRMW